MIGVALASAATLLLTTLAVTSSGWAAFWFALLAVGGIAETAALARRDKGDTLSETVWAHTTHPAARIGLGAFLTWLAIHLTFGI